MIVSFPPDHKHLADALALGWQELAHKDKAQVARGKRWQAKQLNAEADDLEKVANGSK